MSPRKTLPRGAISRLLWPSKVILPTCPSFPSNKARLSSSPLSPPPVGSSLTASCRRPGDHFSSGSSGRWWSPSFQPMSTGVGGLGDRGHTEGNELRTRVLHAGWSSAFLTPTSIFERRGPGRRNHVLPGGIEAVVGADCVVPEEFLAAVCTSFCREGRETSLRKPWSPNAETMRGWPGPRLCLTSEVWDPLLLGKDLGER